MNSAAIMQTVLEAGTKGARFMGTNFLLHPYISIGVLIIAVLVISMFLTMILEKGHDKAHGFVFSMTVYLVEMAAVFLIFMALDAGLISLKGLTG